MNRSHVYCLGERIDEVTYARVVAYDQQGGVIVETTDHGAFPVPSDRWFETGTEALAARIAEHRAAMHRAAEEVECRAAAIARLCRRLETIGETAAA